MRANHAWLLAAAFLTLPRCGGTAILGPVDPDEVTITLSFSGGFAGGGFTLVVDGASGEANRTCDIICTIAPGEDVIPVSSDLVTELAGALEAADVLDLDGTDYGTQCCDQFFVELTYVRGDRSSQVRGTESLLPAGLREAIQPLTALAQGRVPMIVSPETRDTDWPRDSYGLGAVTVDGLTITVELSYSGGCGQHRMDLVAWGGWLESFPVQVNALVTHDDGDDPCDAVVTEERTFDLSTLARAYEEAYGPSGQGRPTVILRLWDPVSASPLGRLVEVGL